jgi:chemotaxis protein MotB
MAKKKRGDAHGGGHGWFVTFADLMGLMMSFFVMLVAFSTMDNQKLKIVAGSMRDAFGSQTAIFRNHRIGWAADAAQAEERRARPAG